MRRVLTCLMVLLTCNFQSILEMRPLQQRQQLTAEPTTPYEQYAASAAEVLQVWYDPKIGLWQTTGWWNSANALTALIEYMDHTDSQQYLDVVANTYARAYADKPEATNRWLNAYYDDEGWWALAWVRAYELTGTADYLATAKAIFQDMTMGWDATCGGGLWWSKERTYKNAIPNELFLQLAARLHNLTPGDNGAGSYLDWAQREWDWFQTSGLINANNSVNDGLNKDGDCKNNQGVTWTYNQGVILGGLVELSKANGNIELLEHARKIALAAIGFPFNKNDVLVEPCELSSNCGADGPQFKGIFMRNLYYLHQAAPDSAYEQFFRSNADSIWVHNRNEQNQFGLKWTGRFDHADAARQSAALDALNSAIPAR